MRLLTAALAGCLYVTVLSGGLVYAASNEYEADTRLAIIDKYVDATQLQQNSLRGLQMEVDIDAKLPKLEKHGKLRALRKISRLGLITYKALGFSGDNTVKQEVITRYLAAESAARENGTIAITPANYKFRYAGRIVQNNVTILILQVTPKKKAVGLFKGEIWIDAATGMPLREEGQFVKTPSLFLKKIAFVREYEIRNGVAYPLHIQSTVDTRIVGRAELEISFSNFSRDHAEDEAAEDDGSGTAAAAPAPEAHTWDVSTAPEPIHMPGTPGAADGPEL
ncbi:MAG: hypothetical protein M3N41_00135 [Acidobacteriota bacterium]|nr:hypothetical protein [Acidobacteriota bacterium]MDP9114378.1 hypothetical protein [Acidobacteriota bacterium]